MEIVRISRNLKEIYPLFKIVTQKSRSTNFWVIERNLTKLKCHLSRSSLTQVHDDLFKSLRYCRQAGFILLKYHTMMPILAATQGLISSRRLSANVFFKQSPAFAFFDDDDTLNKRSRK
uniref:Uncharacterized protein n=1 Tax=Romanomermis culicivorax TaxID=13658 RepID=A0A915JWG1_ROMCU